MPKKSALTARLLASLIVVIGARCSNISLRDYLENPGGIETFTNNYYVFVSSWSTMGDMAGGPYQECNTQFVGAARADCRCTKAAAAKGLRKNTNHQFRAYLGLSGPPSIEARCRIAGLVSACAPNFPGPWFNTNGNVVFNTFISNAGTIDGPILYTEKRVSLSLADQVWTGASATGTHQNECAGWNDTTGTNVNIGDPTASSTAWHNNTFDACNSLKRLYCFATP